MSVTRPTGEQVTFKSSKTGDHVLDDYMEAVERGTKTLSDLMDILFDGTTGDLMGDLWEFRVNSSTNLLQVRVGVFLGAEDGWVNTNQYMFKNRGAWADATAYNRLDIVQSAGVLYLCHTAHTSSGSLDVTKFVAMLTIAAGGGLEFTGGGALQRSALTGDVTASAGSNATSIAANAVVTAKIADANVTLAKLVTIAQKSILGRQYDQGTGVVQQLNGLDVARIAGVPGILGGTWTGDLTVIDAYHCYMLDLAPTTSQTITINAASTYQSDMTIVMSQRGTVPSYINLSGGAFWLHPGQRCVIRRVGAASVWQVDRDKRQKLTGSMTIYVRTTGNNNNHGYDASNPLLTIQAAYDRIVQEFDFNNQSVTINVGAGTFTGGLSTAQAWVGGGTLSIVGAGSASTTISTTSASCFWIQRELGGFLYISALKMQTTTGGRCIEAYRGAKVIFTTDINFGAAAWEHVLVGYGSLVEFWNNYTISGSALTHIYVDGASQVAINSITITLSGTPAFSNSFVYLANNSVLQAYSTVFSGSATGVRGICDASSVIYAAILMPYWGSYFPGNSAFLFRGRVTLSADITVYVDVTNGNDTNIGLSSGAGNALATFAEARDRVCRTLDFAGKNVTIQFANGTYTTQMLMDSVNNWKGGGSLTLRGDPTTPANVVISVTSAHCVMIVAPKDGSLNLMGFKLSTTTAGFGIYATRNATVNISGKMEFGTCAYGHMQAGNVSLIRVAADYSIVGGATIHWEADYHSVIDCRSRTITLTGTPAFSNQFARALDGAAIICNANTFSGAATGARYSATANGVIDTAGGGATYLPGDSAGSTATGGQYI